jgi:hypothetical protein
VKRIADQTLYEILEIPQDASTAAIEAAAERARALYGPGSLATYTLMSPEEATLLGARIDEAHKVLLDPAARSRYDASLAPREAEVRAAVNGANGASTTPFTTPAPVIPALQAPPPPPEPRGAPVPPEAAEPALAPAASEPAAPERAAKEPAAREPAAASAPANVPPPAAPPAPRAPIRLEREIPKPAVPPAPAGAPAQTPAPAAEIDVPMPEGAAWTGPALRRVREARGITIPQIAERTKVTRHHVENIEAERFAALPAPVYLRGILLSLARELRLDGQKVARAYLDRAAAAGQGNSR